jgi:hypothetical protein
MHLPLLERYNIIEVATLGERRKVGEVSFKVTRHVLQVDQLDRLSDPFETLKCHVEHHSSINANRADFDPDFTIFLYFWLQHWTSVDVALE